MELLTNYTRQTGAYPFRLPYEDIEDPDYVRLYEGLFTTSHYDSNNYADAELLSPSLLMEPKRAAANNVV